MRGKRYSGKWFIVCTAPNGLPHDRLGLIVAKRLVKTAVARNALKRMIREAFRLCGGNGGGVGRDMVVQLRSPPGDPAARREELASLIARAVA